MVHDWGGPIGLAALARRPAAVERLVLGNTWAWPTDAVHVQIMSRVMGGPLGRLLIRQFNLFVNAMTTVSALVFLYSPDTTLAAIAVLNMDDAGDIAPAAAMATMILLTSAAVRIAYTVLTRGLLFRAQAWRRR